MYQYKVKKINRVIDGDTIDIDIDLGFHITVSHRVRLKDIDAAETRTKDLEEKAEGIKARLWLEKELAREGEWIIERYNKLDLLAFSVYFRNTPAGHKSSIWSKGKISYGIPRKKTPFVED